MLKRIFELQKSFDATVQSFLPFSHWSKEEKVVALMDMVIQEALEVQNALGVTVNGRQKWWKQSDLTKDGWSVVNGELADVLHFLVSAMLHAGLDAEDILNEYEKKNKENHARQERGY
jgi:NTP pyrophosphatase (non-canonical NTP hydrolase)